MKTIPLDYRFETKRLELRRYTSEDLEFVWDATRYPGFNDGMLWDTPRSKDELVEHANSAMKRWNAGEGFAFTPVDKALSRQVGSVALQGSSCGWSVGFWIHPKYQGAGYATEALAGLLRFCFEELGLKALSACHAEWNVASRAVLERNGFRFKRHQEEGFEKNGEWVAQDSLALSREQWAAENAKP